MTLWEGRLRGTADEVMAFTASLAFDRRLAADDLVGSRAHVRGLARAGVLEQGEAAILLAALDRVGEEIEGGIFAFQPGDEDIHTAVERRVTELAGDVGAKLHTGRSRNDQVATGPAPVHAPRAARHLGGRARAPGRAVAPRRGGV